MNILLSILFAAIVIATIVGLVKPASVLRWDKKPTRLKVVGWGVLAAAISLILIAVSAPGTTSADKVRFAENYIEDGKYEVAIRQLQSIPLSDSLYSKAQCLIGKADSLIKVRQYNIDKVEQAVQDSIKRATEMAKVDTLKSAIENQIKFIDKFDVTPYRNAENTDVLLVELALFKLWGDMVIEGEQSGIAEIEQLAKKLRAKVASIQVREFPLIRKQYAKLANAKLWENDIEVYANGAGNTIINFTGGIFAANKNKQDFQNELSKALEAYRFTQSRYRWYRGADEYTYWKIFDGKDSDLVR